MDGSPAIRINPCLVNAPSHTRQNFEPSQFVYLVEQVAARVVAIRQKHPEIEALAACGNSGLMLMGALSYSLKMPQIAVRKSHDTSHDESLANGYLGCQGYLIIDDLISSGETVARIIRHISETVENRHTDSLLYSSGGDWKQPKCVAALLYNSYGKNYRFTPPGYGMPRLPVYLLGEKSLDIPERQTASSPF